MAYIGNRVATSGTSIKADSSAPANSLRVKSNGNIGVGVAEPSSKLHVAGTVTATAFAGDGSALTGIESLPAAIDVNGSAPDDSLAIDSAGKVGIGTSSPATTLHLSSGSPRLTLTDTGTGVDHRINGDSSVGNLLLEVDINSETASPSFIVNMKNTEAMRINASGDVLPGANGTQDFGSSSLRWANIYTSDLHLSNGIGNYTIVEGEEDLFLYNNKNGKTYKFVLAEVDPSEAPKKMEK